MSKKLDVTLFLLAFAVAAFTQFYLLTEVPGLHFDEAWQAMFSHRILSEPGFVPLSAMNGYTSPVLHFILAAVFAVFGETLLTLRLFLSVMNCLSLLIFVALFFSRGWSRVAVWFTLGWAVLPIFIHQHRFFIEVTAFHTFCFAWIIFFAGFWKNGGRLSWTLCLIAYLAGVYSHVLFISVYFSMLVLAALTADENGIFSLSKTRRWFSVAAALTVPLAIRMAISTSKILPWCLALGLVGFSILPWTRFWKRLPQFMDARMLLIGLPGAAVFFLVFWSGFWPYSQLVGTLPALWIPINLLLLVFVYLCRRERFVRTALAVFLFNLLVTQVLVFKPVSRYYTVPALIFLAVFAFSMARARIEAQFAAALVFLSWNLWSFENHFVKPFQRNGTSEKEVSYFFFHDSARDFRPLQKAFAWAVEKNCQQTLTWLENDRFMYPIHFLKLSAPPENSGKPPCPWKKEDLFLSHMVDGRSDAAGEPFPNVRFLYNRKEWGDLAYWLRK